MQIFTDDRLINNILSLKFIYIGIYIGFVKKNYEFLGSDK